MANEFRGRATRRGSSWCYQTFNILTLLTSAPGAGFFIVFDCRLAVNTSAWPVERLGCREQRQE
jgi:hypothetical protein